MFATGTVSNQVLKSSMTLRRPKCESGAFLNANLTLIKRKLVRFCYRNGFQPSLKSSMTFRGPEQESGALFYANCSNFILIG